MTKRFSCMAAVALLGSACADAPKAPPKAKAETPIAGQLLALTQCPMRIAEARAWVDLAPGAGRDPRNLHVAVKFEKADQTGLVLRSEASTAETLVLELRISDTSQEAGGARYLEPAPSPLYRRIVLRCHGGDVRVLSDIGQG